MSESGVIARVWAALRGGQASDASEGTGRVPALGGWLRWSPALGGLTVFLYAAARDSSASSFLSVLAVGLAIAAAASVLGAFVGFLFGLPRTVDGGTVSADGTSPPRGGMASNTNLEEISDWLTKILVGIGLVQLGAFVTQLSRVGNSLAPGLGGGEGADAFAVCLIVYCMIDGFLLGYLWTRIVVSLRLKDAQRLLQATDAVLATPLPPPPPAPPPAPPGASPPAPATGERTGDLALPAEAPQPTPSGDPADAPNAESSDAARAEATPEHEGSVDAPPADPVGEARDAPPGEHGRTG